MAQPMAQPNASNARPIKEGVPTSHPLRPATHAHFGRTPPQIEGKGFRTWITRGANFVVAVSEVSPGAIIERTDNPDESMVLLVPGVGATIEVGGETVSSLGDSLTIVPPGPSVIRASGKGLVTQVFSNRADDLCRLASNAATYADGAPEVAPNTPWPVPKGGFQLRHYRMVDHVEPKNFGRLFRSTNLMLNVFEPITVPRDTRTLSPHSHSNFEQGSLSLSGTVIHHLRTPWTPDMSTWRPDEHVEFQSPALLVIPATLIHTTRYVGGGPNWFVDIFGPPRIDFSTKQGWVRNADDYPMPA